MTRLIRILLFSLFFFSKGYAINKTGDPFLLGAMFSRTDINGKVYALGNVLLAAFILAVNEINNRTDILPNTPIKISVRDSRLDSNQAVTQTLYLAANAFGNGVGVNAVIGPITSGDSITSAVVAQAFELTQISPAATSPQLSYRKPNFGFFSRTVPSDSFQGQAIADLIAYYNWRKVCVVVSNDSYGNGLANSFSARIKNYKNIQIFVASVGLNLPSYQNVFSLFANDYCRIWVLFMLEIDAGVLIENGYNSNIFVEGTQIIGGDATLDSGLWQNISAANVPKVIKGLMGFLPSFPITQKRGLEFVRSFIDQPSTVGNATACDTTKDDDGNYLYQTLVSPNKFQCLGVNFSTFNSDGSNFQPYTGYAYDAVYAAALAAHSMIYLQKELNPIYWSHVGLNTHYYDTLMNVSFQGATGLVKFSPSNTTDGTNYPEGDRLTDIFYTLYNFQPNAYLQDPSGKSGLVRVGFWTPSLGMRVCSFYQYGPLPIPGCQVIFNTPDNSNPVDGLPPITLDTSTTVTNVLFPMAMIIFAFTFAAFLLFVNLWGKTFLSKIKREKLFYLLIGCLFAGGKVLMFSLNITDSNCSISAWCGHIAVWCIGTTLIMKVSYQQRSFILQVMMRFSDYRRLNEPIKSNHLEFDQLLSRKLQDTSFKLTKSVKLPDADIHSIATPKSSVTPTGRIPGHQDLTNTNIHPLSSSRNSDEAGVEMKYSPSGINHVIDMSVKNMSAFSPSPRLSALVGSMTKQSPTTDNGKYSVIAPSDKTECNHERESTVNTPCIEAEAGNSVPSIEPTHEARMLAASTEAIHDSTPMPEMKPTMVSEHINDSLFMPYGSSVYSPTSIVHKNNSLPFYLTAKGVSVRRVCLGLLFIFVIGFLFLIQFVGIPRVTNVSYTSGPQEYIQMECGYKVSGVSLALVYIEFTALIMGTLYCRWTKYQRVTYKLEQRIIFRCLILFIVLFTVVIAYDNITTDYISYELSAGVAYFILSMLALMTVIYVAVTRHLALEKLPVHRAIADDESPEVVMDLIMKYPSTLGQRDLDNLTVFDWAIAAFEQEYQRKYISGLQDPELDGQDRSLNAVATSLEWWPIINSIVLNTLPVDSKDPDLGPVPAEIHGYMWTRLVQSDRHAQIIEHLLDDNAESRLPEKLAAATDADGRKAVDLASPLCKRVLLESMYFLKRYELTTNERAHYQSRTSIILFAIDHWDQERPVALKMMKHVEQLEKEVKTRQQANFNDTFVVNVNRYYSADLDSLYMTALKKWNLTDYPYCIVMPKGERDVGEILSKENIDLDSMRVVARQIALCLQHVHHIGYVHGDIKPTNILRVNGRELKLIDLDGCTRYMSDGQESTALVGVLGDGPIKFSSGYMPPEYIQNHIADLKLLKKKLKDRRYLWKRKKEKEKSVAPENEASPVSVKGNDTTNTNSTNNTSDETPSKATTNRSGSIFSTKPKDSKRDILEENSEVLSDGGSKSGSRWRKFRNSVSAFTHLPLRDSTRSSIEGKSDHDSAKVLSEIDSNNNSKRDVNIGIDSSEMQSTTYTILPIDEGTKEALASDRSSEMKDAEASEKAPTPADNIGSNNQSKLSINIIESKSADDYEANPSTAIRRRSRGEENNRDVLRASRESRDSLHSQSDASRTAQRYRMLKSSSINTITGIILSRVSSSSIKVASMKLPKESPRFGYLNIANNNEDEANDDMDGDDDSNENDDELEDKNEELMANMNRDDTFNATVVSPAQDMWSFGVLLYHIVVNAPLFLEDNDGNVIQKSDLEALLEWKDDTKLLKLSAVKDLYARNLISLLLTKDPSKRLTMAKVLAHPFLNPGMRPARLEGDPPEYDVFISYRVLTDSDLAEALYNELTSHGLTVFWDKKCLQDGELWEDGFCRGIVKSRIFLPIFSKDAMRNQVLPRLNWENFQPSSSVDNVLLEHRLAIEMMSRGLLEKIYPVFAGPTRTSTVLSPTSESSSKKENIVFEKYNFTDTMDGESCFPACADIVVHDIEAKFADHLDRQGLGLTLSGERLSVKTIVTKISQYQGKALEGPIDGEVKKVVDSVFTMCSSASPPFSRPVLDSFSSFSMPSFNNFGSPSSINLLNRKDAFKAILDNFTSYLESLNTSPDIIALMRERHELLYETEDAGTFLNHFSSLYGTNLADSIPSLGVAQPTD